MSIKQKSIRSVHSSILKFMAEIDIKMMSEWYKIYRFTKSSKRNHFVNGQRLFLVHVHI